jgi:hypothetical protein
MICRFLGVGGQRGLSDETEGNFGSATMKSLSLPKAKGKVAKGV